MRQSSHAAIYFDLPNLPLSLSLPLVGGPMSDFGTFWGPTKTRQTGGSGGLIWVNIDIFNEWRGTQKGGSWPMVPA